MHYPTLTIIINLILTVHLLTSPALGYEANSRHHIMYSNKIHELKK